MKIFVFCLFVLAGSFSLYAQGGLTLRGADSELLSSANEGQDGILLNPSFSPNSVTVFSYIRQLEDDRYIYIYDGNTRKTWEVALNSGGGGLTIGQDRYQAQTSNYNADLDWRPSLYGGEQWFAFVSSGVNDNHDIYLGKIGSSEFVRVTTNKDIDNSPRWSPDGKSLAFISTRTGNGDVYLIRDIEKAMGSGDGTKVTPELLTDTPKSQEAYLSWNPNPEANLLAFSRSVVLPGRQARSFQIIVYSLRGPVEQREYQVSKNNAPVDYTRPIWNPWNDTQLMYVGQSTVDEDAKANIYLSEISWDQESKTLKGSTLKGNTSEVFKGVRLTGGIYARWLVGGKVILTQRDDPQNSNPVFSINVDQWKRKMLGSANYFRELHQRYPAISSFDASRSVLLFATQEGKSFKIFGSKFDGNGLDRRAEPLFLNKNPHGGGGKLKWIAGGTILVGAGAAAVLLGGGDPDPETVPDPISFPSDN